MNRVFLMSFIVLMASCYEAERNCAAYKTGKFKFLYTIDGKEKTGTFERTEHYSIDYFDNTIDSSTVRWINDCEFILKGIAPKSTLNNDAIHIKILSTTDTSYSFEYKLAV